MRLRRVLRKAFASAIATNSSGTQHLCTPSYMEVSAQLTIPRPSIGCGGRVNSSGPASSSGFHRAPTKAYSASFPCDDNVTKSHAQFVTSGSYLAVSSRSSSKCRVYTHEARGLLQAPHASSHQGVFRPRLFGSPLSCGTIGQLHNTQIWRAGSSHSRLWHTTSASWAGNNEHGFKPAGSARQGAAGFRGDGPLDTLQGVVKRLTFHNEVRKNRPPNHAGHKHPCFLKETLKFCHFVSPCEHRNTINLPGKLRTNSGDGWIFLHGNHSTSSHSIDTQENGYTIAKVQVRSESPSATTRKRTKKNLVTVVGNMPGTWPTMRTGQRGP